MIFVFDHFLLSHSQRVTNIDFKLILQQSVHKVYEPFAVRLLLIIVVRYVMIYFHSLSGPIENILDSKTLQVGHLNYLYLWSFDVIFVSHQNYTKIALSGIRDWGKKNAFLCAQHSLHLTLTFAFCVDVINSEFLVMLHWGLNGFY